MLKLDSRACLPVGRDDNITNLKDFQRACLEDDAPTRDEYQDLEKRISKVEKQVRVN